MIIFLPEKLTIFTQRKNLNLTNRYLPHYTSPKKHYFKFDIIFWPLGRDYYFSVKDDVSPYSIRKIKIQSIRSLPPNNRFSKLVDFENCMFLRASGERESFPQVMENILSRGDYQSAGGYSKPYHLSRSSEKISHNILFL